MSQTRMAASEDRASEDPVSRRVREVVDDLTARRVQKPDRERLDKALDAANAPIGGRAGQDQAVGRTITRLARGGRYAAD